MTRALPVLCIDQFFAENLPAKFAEGFGRRDESLGIMTSQRHLLDGIGDGPDFHDRASGSTMRYQTTVSLLWMNNEDVPIYRRPAEPGFRVG